MNDSGEVTARGVPSTAEAVPLGSAPTPAVSAARQRAIPRGQKSRRPVLLSILVSIIGYSAYERLSTRANVDRVVTFESYSDDAVAIGLTDSQPGFVLLSHLSQNTVHIKAQVATSWLTGKHTILSVRTPNRSERIRLRAPLAILVLENGSILPVDVEWSHADFQALLHAADCESGCGAHPHRCGQPLADIASALVDWPPERVPQTIRSFIRGSGG